MTQPETCPICLCPRKTESVGTITHWILSCTCGLTLVHPEGQRVTIDLCRNCNKRVGKGREGSFTQFVFRSDVCSCTSPSPYKSTKVLPRDEFVKHLYEVEVEEDELNLDKGSFPTGRFKPIVELGRGASGTVWLARDRILNKRVAIKILNNLHSRNLIALQSEARAISRLRHPHIVEVSDIGITDSSIAYLVLEYVPGVPLSFILQKHGVLSWSVCQIIFSQICEALSYAHEQGIFHRDVQPGNILLVEESSGAYYVKLIDFGIAKIAADSPEIQATTLAGSPMYTSPDTGMGLPYDVRSELYSVGCVLFESLTGMPPFSGDNALQILEQHANDELPSLSDCSGRKWPSAIDVLMRKALAKNPNNRFQSALEFQDAVMSTTDHDEMQSRPPHEMTSPASSRATLQKTAKTPGLRATLHSSLIVLLVIAGSVGALVILYMMLPDEQSGTKSSQLSKESPEPLGAKLIDDLQFSNNKWRAVFKHGQKIYVGSPESRDSDFSLLNDYKDVENVELFTINENVTGTGLALLHADNLKTLGLATTALTDEGLHAIEAFKTLKALTIEWNTRLTDDGMACLPRLRRLECLDLRYMKLPKNSLSVISACPSLKELTVTSSKPFDNKDLPLLARLTKLEDLTLIDQRINDADCDVISQIRGLKKLCLKNNRLTDRGLSSLAKLRLESLNVSGNGITDKGLVVLARIRDLKALTVFDCPKLSPDGMEHFQESLPNCRVSAKNDSG